MERGDRSGGIAAGLTAENERDGEYQNGKRKRKENLRVAWKTGTRYFLV